MDVTEQLVLHLQRLEIGRFGKLQVALVMAQDSQVGQPGRDLRMLVSQQLPLHHDGFLHQRFGSFVIAVFLHHEAEIVELLGQVRMGQRAAQFALHGDGALHDRDRRVQITRLLDHLGEVLQRARDVAVVAAE